MGGKKKNNAKKSTNQTLAEKMQDAMAEKIGLDTQEEQQVAKEESKLNESSSTIATESSQQLDKEEVKVEDSKHQEEELKASEVQAQAQQAEANAAKEAEAAAKAKEEREQKQRLEEEERQRVAREQEEQEQKLKQQQQLEEEQRKEVERVTDILRQASLKLESVQIKMVAIQSQLAESVSKTEVQLIQAGLLKLAQIQKDLAESSVVISSLKVNSHQVVEELRGTTENLRALEQQIVAQDLKVTEVASIIQAASEEAKQQV